MGTNSSRVRRAVIGLGFASLGVGLAIGMAACTAKAEAQLPTPPAAIPAAAATAQSSPTPVPTKALLSPVKIQPDTGFVGTASTLTAEGLPPGQQVELLWATWEGSYQTNVMPETIEFVAPRYTDRRTSLGKATTDAQGRLATDFKVPNDYGGVHDIYVSIDGRDVARGGFQIKRSISVGPTEGPVGTAITIAVTGMGKPPIEHMLSVRYDNQYTGFISGVTGHGSATAQIRAAGGVGLHTIELSGAGNHGGGYLNNQQSPYASLFPKDGAFRFTFNVTSDGGAPTATVQQPAAGRVASLAIDAPRTTAQGGARVSNVVAALSPSSGKILSPVKVNASGLRPGVEVELRWMTAKGNRVTAAGWDLVGSSLGTAMPGADGSLQADVATPDGLGGWHSLDLVQAGEVIAQLPFYVEHSLVGVTPARVRVGEQFAVHLKGIGWTELDNTVAVTYDNAYLGYACGFNSNGDIVLNLTASGAPGTHLIDIYPTTFQGKATGRWGFQMPQLNGLEDHPGLDRGYSLPIYRLAVEVVP